MTDQPDVSGTRILVLEDEPMVCMAMEDALLDLGCIVLGPFMQLDDAFDFVRDHKDEIDIALLDINIQGERSFSLADQLVQLNIPFFFSTGYDEAGIDWHWRSWPNIGKLFTRARLADMISQQRHKPALTTT